MKILFLSRWFPFPADNGSRIRISNLLRGLSQHHEVTLLSFSDQPEVSRDASEVRSICRKVEIVEWREFNPDSVRSLVGFFSLKPRSLVDTFSADMAQKIQKTLAEDRYDLVIASQLSMAAYFRYFGGVPAVFEEVELGLSIGNALDLKSRLRHAFTWFKLRMYLSQLLRRFRICTVASAQERRLLMKNFPGYGGIVEVIPNCVDTDEYNYSMKEPAPNSMVFSGSFRYLANYEAVRWFVRDVFPRILARIPNASLTVTGDHANLPLPSERNITRAGRVDDIKSLIASCAVSIAPLQTGGGTRLKILEAMAIGTPVVSTSKGAEGLDAEHEKHIVIADDPESFADNVVKLLEEKTLRQILSGEARKLVEEKYDWAVVLPQFLNLLKAASV